MSKKEEINSNDIESKNSQIIIISKGRLSSAKNNSNYMTLQEGKRKLTIKLKNETLSKKEINKAVSGLKKEMQKNSRSLGNNESENNNINKSSHIQNILKSPFNEKELNHIIKKVKLNSILSVETTKSFNMVKSTENEKVGNEIYNDNDNEIKIAKISFKNNNDGKNDLNKNEDIEHEINEEDTININIKNGNININNENNINFNNKKIISQNYFNNTSSNSCKNKIESINKYKSEEIKFINSQRINEEDKKNNGGEEKNPQPSEITTKSILGSVKNQNLGEKAENNHKNIYHLMTENDVEEKISVKSKNDLISVSKSVKIEENEDEEDEYEEVEDEYDEKIKDDNNRKMIKSLNIINNNNLHNIDNNNNDNPDNFQKLKKEFNDTEQNQNNRVLKSLTMQNANNNIYRMCCVCEHAYPTAKLFVAECYEHYLCKRCTKNYFEEIIEDGSKKILCPFTNCKAKVNIKDLMNIISSDHYKRLTTENQENDDDDEETKNKLVFTRIRTNYNKENIKLYTKKHVLDINSNKNFFNYNNAKVGYCPFCFEESLFSKTNTHYHKCFNCLSKVCKYCFKEFVEGHMDIHNKDHCKVYYRIDENINNKKKKIMMYLTQLFFVLACFYLTFAGSFYFFKEIFVSFFNIRKKRNIFGYIFAYFFATIIFIITIPFIFLLYPYFPSILSLCDY